MAATTWLIIPAVLVVPMLLTIPAQAGNTQPIRPVCNAKTRGSLWPEKTSRGAAVPIEICAPKHWAYSWQQLTVDVTQLRAAAQKPVRANGAAVTPTAADAKTATTTAPPE
jgi:hypothetical protein